MTNAVTQGLTVCLCCRKVHSIDVKKCDRCEGKIFTNIANNIPQCWSLGISAAILYIPANLLPIMNVEKLGVGEPSTIITGIIELLQHGMIPIAVIVFIASVVIPVMKLLILFWLLWSVRVSNTIGDGIKTKYRMVLFRSILLIGRWSMLDVFVVAIMVTLVQFGQLGEISAGGGIYPFSAVVILTMLAFIRFDTRLLWS